MKGNLGVDKLLIMLAAGIMLTAGRGKTTGCIPGPAGEPKDCQRVVMPKLGDEEPAGITETKAYHQVVPGSSERPGGLIEAVSQFNRRVRNISDTIEEVTSAAQNLFRAVARFGTAERPGEP
ncbi:MAG: hypothetical protein GXX09_06835 [Syntrophomonadaceae bacterium]|nr:hypothetical protein [Syntrophomonadaceae bacterium]